MVLTFRKNWNYEIIASTLFVLFKLGQSWAGISYSDLGCPFSNDNFNIFCKLHVHYACCNKCNSWVERCVFFSNLIAKFLCDCLIDIIMSFICICVINPNLVPNWWSEYMSTFLAGVIPLMHHLNFKVRANLSIFCYDFFNLAVADHHYLALVKNFRAFSPMILNFQLLISPQPFFPNLLVTPTGSDLW